MTQCPLKILIVDDSPTVQNMLVDGLQGLGHQTFTVSTAEEADALLAQQQGDGIDLIFLDIVLPGMSGLDYLEKLRKEREKITVIVMTGHESPKNAIEAIEKGAHEYVVKPIEPEQMEIVLQLACKVHQLEQEKEKMVEGRIKQFEEHQKDTDEAQDDVGALKKEVNELLAQLGRPKKYRI